MSQNREDEARGLEYVEEDYCLWECGVCKKVKYTKQIAAFLSEGLSPYTIICFECNDKNIEEYEEKKAKEKKKDASKKEEDENMDDCGWKICD